MEKTNGARDIAVKVLTIIGFVVTAVLLVWLIGIAIMRAPSAFSSLANIASRIQSYKPATEITLEVSKTVVNSTEPLTLTWSKVAQPGAFTLAYPCNAQVTLRIDSDSDTPHDIVCDTPYTLPDTTNTATVSVESTKERFNTVPLTVSFVDAQKNVLFETEKKVTVVNAKVPVTPTNETPSTTPKPTTQKPVSTPTASSKPTTSVKPAQPTYSLAYPTSNPDGYIDLSVNALTTGSLERGVFTRTTSFDRDDRNAIQFTIKNIGTKTSESWRFEATLPNGVTYTSETQAALKPQEKATFILGFSTANERDNRVSLRVTTDARGDHNSTNDVARTRVRIVD